MRKCDDKEGPFSAIILAAAGLLRMDYGNRIAQYLEPDDGMLYAVGQGALAIECRDGDEAVLSILKGLQDEKTALACTTERSVMRTLEGGCSVPIGVETRWTGDGRLRLRATVVNPDGTQAVDAIAEETVDSAEAAEAFGREVAQKMVDDGAGKILDVVSQARASAMAGAV
jgi:hydroxymethylbilane synthase